MKKIILSLITLFLLTLSNVDAKTIATVDLDEIIKNSKAMTALNKEMEEQKKDSEKLFKTKEQDLNNQKTSLESQIKTLSQEAAQQKVMEFQQKVIQFQQEIQLKDEQLKKLYLDSILEITEEIKVITSEMKNEKGSEYDFEIVIPVSTIIYSEKDLDISAEVLSRLNKKIKTLKALKAFKK